MMKAVIRTVGILMFLSSAQGQTVMTREEAGVYALRAAIALNTSVHWLNTSDLLTGEEVADTESDKIDFHALRGLNYEEIVSIDSSGYIFFRGWLREINYRYPCSGEGNILVNAFSGEVLARGKFPTEIVGSLNEEQAVMIASRIVNSFYRSIDHEWEITSSTRDDGSIIIFFNSFKPSIGLKRGRCYAYVEFSTQGFIYEAYFYPLRDDIIPSITLERAKQLVVNALEEAYATGKETYLIITHHGTRKLKLPKVRFVCLGKHPEAHDPPDPFSMLPAIPVHWTGEGLYFYYEDDFLQPKYVYAVLATVESELGGKFWTYYLVDAITSEVEGYGLTDIYFMLLGGSSVNEGKISKISGEEVRFIVLNNQQVGLQNTLFDNNRVYIAQDYLPAFKVQMRDSKLYGRNGEIRLAKDELRRFKGKVYVPLRRVCEVSGIRLWWDNERKVPILRAEWLEPRKLLAQKR